MRFGLLCSARATGGTASAPPGQRLRDWLELNEEAERLGFHSTFLVEHHFTGSDQVSHAGAHWRFDDIVVEPKPAQTPHPPLWMAAGSHPSVTRAATAGHDLILDQYVDVARDPDRPADGSHVLAYRNPARPAPTLCTARPHRSPTAWPRSETPA